jgi:hypothetical protein
MKGAEIRMAEKAFEPTGMMGPQIFGLPIDRETLFSNHKSIYKKRFTGFNRIFTDNIPCPICNRVFICLPETIPVCIYQLPYFSCAHDAKLQI